MGIGAATTRAFAREGAKVAFTWISSEAEAQAIEKEINDAGGTALAIKADLTTQAEVDAPSRSSRRSSGRWTYSSPTPGASSPASRRPRRRSISGTNASTST